MKFYGKREGCLDLATSGTPDFYLVLTGPTAGAICSRGARRPLVIEAVYLFESAALLTALSRRDRPPKIGIATSVADEYWTAAEIWPWSGSANPRLTAEQGQTLALFVPGS